MTRPRGYFIMSMDTNEPKTFTLDPANERARLFFECRICNGSGIIKNPHYEACRNDPGYPFRDGAQCDKCPSLRAMRCKAGEIVECAVCLGACKRIMRTSLWRIKSIEEED